MKPTLPEPSFDVLCGQEPWYSPETVRRLIDEAYAAGLEDAALICDSVNNYSNPMTANDCADEIRALKDGS